MKNADLAHTPEHGQDIYSSKFRQDTGNDLSQSTFILLDSDEEDDTEKYKTSINKRDDDMFSLTIHTEAELSAVSNNDTQRSNQTSSAVHILSSPSPSPTTSRLQDDIQTVDTSWLSPLSPTNHDLDVLSSSHPSNKPKETPNSPATARSSLFTKDTNDFLSLSPNLFDKHSSMDLDTQLLLSDNDSVDSLPSPNKLISQMRDINRNTKHRTHTITSTSISASSGRKDKGKQPATYSSTKPTTKTFLSDRLWEWDDYDNDYDSASTSLIGNGTSTALFDESCDASQETLPVSKKEAKKIQRQKDQEAKKRSREEDLRRKEQEKAHARQLKEEAKQLQQVNRLRKDRDELMKEMTVVVSDRSFMESTHGQLLRATLLDKDTRIICQPTIVTEAPSYTLTWKRECKADWDEDQQQFIPFANGQIESKDEQAVLVFMTAESLVDIIHRDRVDIWIDSILQSARGKQLFLMIEGLEPFYKKKMNWRRRQFTSTVMGNIAEDSGSGNNSSSSGGSNSNSNSNINTNTSDNDDTAATNTTRPRKRKKKDTSTLLMENGPSRDKIEDTLTYLQVIKDVMLIQTLNEEDSVDCLVCLTTDLAKALYNNINTAALCKGQGGAPRSGVDADDVWLKMLQEIQNCTPAVAKSIADEYPNPMSLYQEYIQMTSPSARDSLLANLEVQRSVLSNKDRTINKVMSAKIHKIFMSDDPTYIVQ
ncbi:hypothetical protein BCR42DRAFT_409498 [Absidia repens]|uniref:Uncharacterized protein n=1 Tax=Absidia repens TaxID=90262 RepID=A0A1X2IR79_9FUNG|nr:hypothetical protein BCR42DRAFT_409498 [Absidia repens]